MFVLVYNTKTEASMDNFQFVIFWIHRKRIKPNLQTAYRQVGLCYPETGRV